MPTIGTIICDELHDSGKVTFSKNGLVGTRNFNSSWDDAFTLAQELMARVWDDTPGVLYRRVAQYPWILPNGIELFCSDVSIRGKGKSGSGGGSNIIYDRAFVDATYEAQIEMSDGDDPDVLGDADIEFSAEFLATPKNTWMYKDTSYRIGENVGILLCIQEYTVRVYGLDSIPWETLRDTRGRINDKEWNGAPKGRVLFLGGSSSHSWTAGGTSLYDMVLKFKEKENDWNYVLGNDGIWHEIVDVKTGNANPYNYADLTRILVP